MDKVGEVGALAPEPGGVTRGSATLSSNLRLMQGSVALNQAPNYCLLEQVCEEVACGLLRPTFTLTVN